MHPYTDPSAPQDSEVWILIWIQEAIAQPVKVAEKMLNTITPSQGTPGQCHDTEWDAKDISSQEMQWRTASLVFCFSWF